MTSARATGVDSYPVPINKRERLTWLAAHACEVPDVLITLISQPSGATN